MEGDRTVIAYWEAAPLLHQLSHVAHKNGQKKTTLHHDYVVRRTVMVIHPTDLRNVTGLTEFIERKIQQDQMTERLLL